VTDRDSKAPFPRPEQAAERVLAAGRDAGLLLYSSTGHVDGVNGDLVMLGPPFTLTDDDTGALVERTVAAIGALEGPG
jgi:adenosylmethionine-8-amino-7-oxononanoate aminotransferase